jgi:hypothetical protein
MKYLALIYTDESDWDALSDDERSATYARYRAFGESAGAKMLGGAELGPNATATTVRVRDGETVVTDGPFVETKEALGGFYVLECDTIDEAVALAAQIPGAETGAIEVRPGYVDASAEQAEQSEEVVA